MKLIEVHSSVFPFSGFKALTLVPFLFIRKGTKPMTDADYRHEQIHARQELEMLFVGFFIWYGIEAVVRYFTGAVRPYRNISLEAEAYENEDDADYLNTRKWYAWVHYL